MMQWKSLSRAFSGLIVGLCVFSAPVLGNCWQDTNLVALASRVARQHFPRIDYLPDVVVCSADEFAPSIGGSFNANPRPVIRIPVWQLGRPELNTVLAHELGHYQSFLNGTDDGTASGHGPGWMAAMLAAGLYDEARRVAATVPGADRALAQVQGEGPNWGQRRAPRGRTPETEYLPPQYENPRVVTCYLQPENTIVHDRCGRQYVTTVYVQVCRVDR